MERTPNLDLPYIIAAQAQKHVTHNEAIRALDAVVHAGVASRETEAPPQTPQDGVRYIVPSGAAAQSAWNAQADTIAAWQDGAWAHYGPKQGWTAYVADENTFLVHDGVGWQAVSPDTASFDKLGVNATADANNRLVVSAPATLFDAESDDHRLAINKKTVSDTASILLQTGFQSSAEIGLTGTDDLTIRTSADGNVFRDAVVIDRTSGQVDLPLTRTAKLEATAPAGHSIPNATVTYLAQLALTTNTLRDSTVQAGIITIGPEDAGLWSLEFQSNIPGPASLKGVYIRRNGDPVAVMQFDGTTGAEVLKALTTVQLVAGDTIDFAFYQATGTPQTPGATTRIFAYRIGN